MKLEESRHVQRQNTVADKVAAAWNCTWGQMGPYSPFDVYLMRDLKVIALAEIRTRRDRTCSAFSTVLIDLDKWFSLMQAEIALQMPGMYIVAFTDGIWYVRIGTLPVNQYKINFRGRKDRPQAMNDLSPAIEVPCSEFKKVCDSNEVFEA